MPSSSSLNRSASNSNFKLSESSNLPIFQGCVLVKWLTTMDSWLKSAKPAAKVAQSVVDLSITFESSAESGKAEMQDLNANAQLKDASQQDRADVNAQLKDASQLGAKRPLSDISTSVNVAAPSSGLTGDNCFKKEAVAPAAVPESSGGYIPEVANNKIGYREAVFLGHTESPKKIVKKAKKAKKEKEFYCDPELIKLYNSGLLHDHIRNSITADIAGMCYDNGLPRSGAKYKLVELLLDHVKIGAFKAAHGSNDSLGGRVAAEFAGVKVRFAGARSLYRKHIKNSLKKSCTERLEITLAATRGMDHHIFVAITGKDCGKYNGKYDDVGETMQDEVGLGLKNLLFSCAAKFTPDQLQSLLSFIADKDSTKCEPYGFMDYKYLVFNLWPKKMCSDWFMAFPETVRVAIEQIATVQD